MQFDLVPELATRSGDARGIFSQLEEKTFEYWKKIKAFETSYKRSLGKKEYVFYDGPPFATGLPHYGHILAGTIKDIVTRYAHQTGHCVSRRFGWDCHGLPVEFEIDKKLGITGRDDVMELGIKQYNAECRNIVMRYAKEWERVVQRMGRWIDFKNDYKTLNPSFMETVWWIFKEMYKKGLVYQGFKVMPYSTVCNTSLSNFEANQNYKDVTDPAVIVSFPLIEDENVSMLAWTTTPWTLPSNLGLCCHPEMTYVKIKDTKTDAVWIVAECRLESLYPKKKKKKKKKKKDKKDKGGEPEKEKEPYTILGKMVGKDLLGKRYVPLFEYFRKTAGEEAWKIMNDTFVTEDSGTGIVHMAPAFGEDDYRICMTNGVIKRGGGVICPVDDNGRFTEEVTDFAGQYIKDADRHIIRLLKQKKRLVDDSNMLHSYPHCWRSDSPLIYKAVPSWFVNVPKIKDRLIKNNLKSYWVPKFVQEKRFHNWLQDARDWAISRSRFWGTPLPIWVSDDKKEIEVIGSIEELKEKSGVKDITDIHRDNIDHITIKKNGKVLRRVDEVFDCWFESGSMPYAQVHYPFENKEKFEKNFPADFIAEGLDQTRGWFYTLMVISTALFDKPPFKNLIVNGLVLAADGKKMSKRLQNYPKPDLIVKKFGADALRLYLINSPVVRAEPLKFMESGVKDVIKDIFIPWFNSYRFFITQARRLEKREGKKIIFDKDIHKHTTNVMDKWILSSLQSLIKNVREEMRKYYLYTVIPYLLKFVDSLSKWYLRFNKKRLKGDHGIEDCHHALCTLFKVLYDVCRLMAPFTPFLVEHMYQNLRNALPKAEIEDSVHYLMVPEPDESVIDVSIERRMANLQIVMELGRQVRDKSGISLRVPVPEITVACSDQEFLNDIDSLRIYIKNELKPRKLKLTKELGLSELKIEPDLRFMGQSFGRNSSALCKQLRGLSHEQVMKFRKDQIIVLKHNGEEYSIPIDKVLIARQFTGDETKFQSQAKGDIMLIMSKVLDADCREEGLAREAMSKVQQLRKAVGLNIEQLVDVWYEMGQGAVLLPEAIKNKADLITKGIRVRFLPKSQMPAGAKIIPGTPQTFEVKKEKITIYLTHK